MENCEISYISELLKVCKRILASSEPPNIDFVATVLENVVQRLSLRQHEVDIPWADEVLQSLSSTLEDLEEFERSQHNPRLGRPRIEIPAESLQELLALKFTVVSIAKLYGVSEKTIFRRLKELNLSVKQTYANLTADELEDIIGNILLQHPNTGYKRMLGFLSASGYRVKEYSVREAMRIVDPIGVSQRTRENRAIFRRVYFVRYSNERWHLDTNMKLIRWKLIVRSCIDGNSRCCVYVSIGGDNKARSNMISFMDGVRHYGLPQGIRTDKGNENRSIARFMLTLRGMNKGVVLTGRSTHNQRIERFWSDLYRETGVYINVFHSMEEGELLDVENPNHLFVLHCVYIPRLQRALEQFMIGWNHHKVSTAASKTPYQMWLVNRPPEDTKCRYDSETIDRVYEYCLGTPVQEDTEYHPVRNPSPITHTLTDHQLELLSQVDMLAESPSFGVDIYCRCINVLGL